MCPEKLTICDDTPLLWGTVPLLAISETKDDENTRIAQRFYMNTRVEEEGRLRVSRTEAKEMLPRMAMLGRAETITGKRLVSQRFSSPHLSAEPFSLLNHRRILITILHTRLLFIHAYRSLDLIAFAPNVLSPCKAARQ